MPWLLPCCSSIGQPRPLVINLYLVGDQSFGKPPDDEDADEYLPFNYLMPLQISMSTGPCPNPTWMPSVSYYQQHTIWRKQARKKECKFTPSVSPGFNDRSIGIEVNHTALSLKLNTASMDLDPSLNIRSANHCLKSPIDLFLSIRSMNGTKIHKLNPSMVRELYTGSLEYAAYASRYLDLLHYMTTDGSGIAREQEEIDWLELKIEGKIEEEDAPTALPKQPF